MIEEIENDTAYELKAYEPMVKRKYMIKKIPQECLDGKEFDAPYQWDLFCLWTGPNGTTYGIFEKVEEV